MKKFFDGIAEWVTSFFAVDNSVNEQTVVGVFWGAVAFALIIISLWLRDTVSLDLIITTLSASLLAFGIAGFKKL